MKDVQRFEQGTWLTVRMRGHSRTNGVEYFAPAIVLSQFPEGELEIVIFDSSSGTAYNHAYAPREVSTRQNTATGETEMYEVQSNIGTVLFSPEMMTDMALISNELERNIRDMNHRLKDLESRFQVSQSMQAVQAVQAVPHGATGEFVEPAKPVSKK